MSTTTQTNNIGKVISFNERDYNSHLIQYPKITTAINELISLYLTFEIGDFTKKILIVLYNSGTVEAAKIYATKTREQLDKAGITLPVIKESIRKTMQDDLSKLDEKISVIKNLINLTDARINMTVNISITDYDVENNKAFISDAFKEKLKDHFSITIKTEQQSEFYDDCMQLKKLYDSFTDKYRKLSQFPIEIVSNHSQAFFTTDQFKHLTLCADLLSIIK